MNQPNNSPLAIVCAADDGYAMQMAIMLRSVLENVSACQPVSIFVIDGGITESNRKKILGSFSNTFIKFQWIEGSGTLPENLPLDPSVLHHVNNSVYYRLLLADFLPTDLKKVVYLDCDLIVLHDLQQLWQVEIADNYVMAVQDPGIPFVSSPYGLKKYQELNIPPNSKYFNSGVLIVNLKKWRAENISTKLLEYIEKYIDDIQHHDQDVMNAIFAGKWGEISPQWNQMPVLFDYLSWKDSPYREIDYHNAVNNPFIVHFAGSSKPWNGFEKHPFTDKFFRYLDLTAWSGWRFTIWRRLLRKIGRAIG